MERFERVFEALNHSGARYVVVGGVAVNLHGFQRLTQDLDLVIELTEDGSSRALQALASLGYAPHLPVSLADFANAATREKWIRDRHMVVFPMYDDRQHMTVDIFTRYPIDFEELWSAAITVALSRTNVRVASLDHLIRMKRETGRPMDVIDVEALEEIRRLLAEERPE
jgi:predicted nucleotidyltransferase